MNSIIPLLWVVFTLFTFACSKEKPTEIPECLPFSGIVNDRSITGEVVVNYNGQSRESRGGVLMGSEITVDSLVGTVLRYCSTPFTDPSVGLINVPINRVGDTLEIKTRCFDERCPTDFPTADILSMSADVFVSSYVEDPDQLSWMVIDSWDNESRTLKFTFEMHFVRNAFSAGREDLAPPTVSLTNGKFDAFHLRE